MKLANEVQNLWVEGLEISSKQILKFKVMSSQLTTTKAHVMLNVFHPEKFANKMRSLRDTCPNFSTENFSVDVMSNSYYNGSSIDDEIKYVLDRRQHEIYMGNFLEKPTLLLNRQFNKETVLNQEQLRKEKPYGAPDCAANMRFNKKSCMVRGGVPARYPDDNYHGRQGRIRRWGDIEHGDLWLGQSGVLVKNLFPDTNGEIQVDLSEYG